MVDQLRVLGRGSVRKLAEQIADSAVGLGTEARRSTGVRYPIPGCSGASFAGETTGGEPGEATDVAGQVRLICVSRGCGGRREGLAIVHSANEALQAYDLLVHLWCKFNLGQHNPPQVPSCHAESRGHLVDRSGGEQADRGTGSGAGLDRADPRVESVGIAEPKGPPRAEDAVGVDGPVAQG